MGLGVTCPRCGGAVRPPGIAHSQWRCLVCGPTVPLYTAQRANHDVIASAITQLGDAGMPMWCPWPLPTSWTVTGVAWAVDDHGVVAGTAIACTGPTPFSDGPADVVLVAERPGLGLGPRLAGVPGLDLGPSLTAGLDGGGYPARVKAAGHPTPLWSVQTPDDRSAYAGEAKGYWLYAVAWPAQAGYLFTEDVVLHDLSEWLPQELVFGAPSPHLTC